MKLKIKSDSIKSYYVTDNGTTITKTEWTEVDNSQKEIRRLIEKEDIMVEEPKIEIAPVSKKQKKTNKKNKKSQFVDSFKTSTKETFTANLTTNDNSVLEDKDEHTDKVKED